MTNMETFVSNHPKAARWLREGGLFIVFSYIVTIFKYLLLQFLPKVFESYAEIGWTWPGIEFSLKGIPFTLSLIGYSVANGGVAYMLANYISTFLGECINFPCQRNITFKSKGKVGPQIFFHFLATIAVLLVMNLFNCIWVPVATALSIPDYLYNIVVTFVTGGVSMVIIFAVDKMIFSNK